MTARVLVVDDVLANVKLLEARLTAEYFDVVTAMSGQEALEICKNGGVDIVLLDVMMPVMDGHEVCRRLKEDMATHYIPVIMVTALDQPSDLVKGLEAGADDFLTKPVNDVALITRVKSQVRIKTLIDELRMRASTGEEMGINDEIDLVVRQPIRDGRILVIDDRASSYERVVDVLSKDHSVDVESDSQQAVFVAAEGDYELVIVSLGLKEFDGLRLCSQIRSLERTRHLPIMVISDPSDNTRLLRGLDMGINDYVMRPIDKNELFARVRTQIRRKRYTDKLRDSFQHNLEMAITDPLTGLHNRRYMESHLNTLVDKAKSEEKPLTLLLLDIDYFKAVNDTHGHEAGDDVLREFSVRLRSHVRGIDLACRYGGEEFVVVMPETNKALAFMVAERVRQQIAGNPFIVRSGENSLQITVSIGIAGIESDEDTPATVLRRADEALYAAKRDGRNRVVSDAA